MQLQSCGCKILNSGPPCGHNLGAFMQVLACSSSSLMNQVGVKKENHFTCQRGLSPLNPQTALDPGIWNYVWNPKLSKTVVIIRSDLVCLQQRLACSLHWCSWKSCSHWEHREPAATFYHQPCLWELNTAPWSPDGVLLRNEEGVGKRTSKPVSPSLKFQGDPSECRLSWQQNYDSCSSLWVWPAWIQFLWLHRVKILCGPLVLSTGMAAALRVREATLLCCFIFCLLWLSVP